MNIQNSVIGVVAGVISMYGVVAPVGNVNLEKLEEVSNKFDKSIYRIVELEDNERKLVDKYNKLYIDANELIDSLRNDVEDREDESSHKDKKIKELEVRIKELEKTQNENKPLEENESSKENEQSQGNELNQDDENEIKEDLLEEATPEQTETNENELLDANDIIKN